MHVLALLNRHSLVFGNYRWTEFDEDFLQKHVESVVLVDLDEMVTHCCCFILFCLVLISEKKQTLKNTLFSSLSPLIWRAALCPFTSSHWMRTDLARSVWRRMRSFQQPTTGCCQQVTPGIVEDSTLSRTLCWKKKSFFFSLIKFSSIF